MGRILHFQQLGQFREFDVNISDTWDFPDTDDDRPEDEDDDKADTLEDLIDQEENEDGEPHEDDTFCDDVE